MTIAAVDFGVVLGQTLAFAARAGVTVQRADARR
jgi:hypothetical protein